MALTLQGAIFYVLALIILASTALAITLPTDFDQEREQWVKKPMDFLTAAHLSPTGDRVVLTARGQVFVAPARQGRTVEATRNSKVRYRNGRFFPDGKSLLALSDESGEVEFWRVPANGVGAPSQLTTDGKVLRWDGIPSPDGRFIIYSSKTSGKEAIYVMRSDGSGQTRVSQGRGKATQPAWSTR